jgi:hypothetical protein
MKRGILIAIGVALAAIIAAVGLLLWMAMKADAAKDGD